MTKILIINQHGCNRGDEAACLGMLHGIRQFIKDAEFTVLTVNPLWLEGIENQATQLRNLNFPNLGKYRTLLRAARLLLAFYTGFLNRGFPPKFIDALHGSDLIISAPGGPYIGDLYPSTEIEVTFHIMLGIMASKPIMIYGPSMGPFNNRKRNILRKYLLNKIDLITIREAMSAEYLNTLDIKTPVYTTSDAALQCPINPNRGSILRQQYAINNSRKHIGFVPLELERFKVNRDRMHYIELIVQLLRMLTDHFDANIVFFPQGYGAWRDYPFLEFLVSVSGLKDRIVIIPEDCSSIDQQSLIGTMDAFVSFRYHPSIFALRQSVPCVAVAYEHKMMGFMRAINMEMFCLHLETSTAVQICNKLEEFLLKRDIIDKQLKTEIRKLEKRAWMNSFLASLILKHKHTDTSIKKFADVIDKEVAGWDETMVPYMDMFR